MSQKILMINLGWEQTPLLHKLSEMDLEIYGVHNNSLYDDQVRYKDVLIADFRDWKKFCLLQRKLSLMR